MGSGRTRRRRRRHVLQVSFVVGTLFAAGLVSAGVVSGAGPLALLSTDTETTTTTETTRTETTTESATTESTTTEPTESTTTDTSPPPPAAPPTIESDKPDYAPGELVTLTGESWQPGESVRIDVNDDQGQTWRRTVTVVANADGEVIDQFNLPEWFVAVYRVVATGTSGTATTTFTDGTVRIRAVGTLDVAAPVDWVLHDDTTCTGAVIDSDSISASTSGNGTNVPVAVSSTQSLHVTAGVVTGRVFSSWSGGDFTTGTFTPTSNPGCLQGTTPTQNTQVNYGAAQANTPPAAQGVSVSTNEDTAIAITLTGTDAEQCELAFSIVAGPSTGSLGSISNNACAAGSPNTDTASVTYTPSANFTGSDSFTYLVNDGSLDSAVATVSITVTAVDDPPTAVNDVASVGEDSGANTIDVLANDVDIDGGPKAVASVTQPVNGSVTNNGTNVSYEPDTNYCNNGSSTDDFTYTLDGSSTATVAVTVTCVDDPPVVAFTSGATSLNEGQSDTYTFSITDPDSTSFTYDAGYPMCGTGGSLVGTPTIGSSGGSFECSFSDGPATPNVAVRVRDASSASNEATRLVTVANLAPTITNVVAVSPIDEGGSSTITVTATDPAGANDPLEYQFDCDGDSTYEVGPQAGNSHACAFGDDGSSTVNVRVSDGDGGADIDSTTVVVQNVPPTITNVVAVSPIDEGGSSTITVTATDPAGANDPLEYQFDCDGDSTYEVGPQAGNSHACAFGDDGSSTVNVRVSDGDGGADIDSTTVVVQNVPPTITNVVAVSPIDEGGSSTITVTATDPAGANDPLEYQFDCDGDSTYEVGPQAGNSHACAFGDDGSSTVNVRVSDGDGGADTDSTTVVVQNVAPTKPGKPTTSGPNPNSTGAFTLTWAASTDVPADTVTYMLEHKDADDAAYSTVTSGIASNSYAFGGSNPAEAEGTWTYRVTASDEDGGVSDVSDESDPIKVDKSDPNTPSVSADRPPDYAGDGGWYKDTVTVSFSHNGDPLLPDGSAGSGVDPASIPAPQTFTASGSHSRTGTVKDNAGNESASASLTVQVDATNPTFGECTGGPFLLGSGMQPVSITASDAHSGLDAGASTLTGAVDASTIGTKTVTFTAVDNVDHSFTKTCSYSVIFNFHGFFQPVDNNGVFNTVNAGRAIPVKFDLSGNQGLNIFFAGYPKSTPVPCDGSSGVDELEQTVTAGSSSLSYSEGQPFGQYNYVWKTESGWANTCRRLDVKFVDGQLYSAFFKFRK